MVDRSLSTRYSSSKYSTYHALSTIGICGIYLVRSERSRAPADVICVPAKRKNASVISQGFCGEVGRETEKAKRFPYS